MLNAGTVDAMLRNPIGQAALVFAALVYSGCIVIVRRVDQGRVLMVSLVFGLAVVGAFALFATGWRLARADALEGWDVADIMLLRDERRRKRRVGPLDRVAKTLSPQLAILLGPRLMANLRRRIDLAGRPDGMTVDSFLQLVVKYGVVLGSVALVFLLLGNLLSMFLALADHPDPAALAAGRPCSASAAPRSTTTSPTSSTCSPSPSAPASASARPWNGWPAASSGPLHEELLFTLHQLDVGVSRRQAFSNLRDRCDSDPMASFVSAFVQAEELGAPLSEALSGIARDSRRDAAQRARQKAARTVPRVTLLVSTMMVLPTVIIIGVGMYLGSDVDLGSIFGG